jgi:hypothetical protein
MGGTTLLLGPVLFQDFEAPGGINFGGAQRLVVHKLPDGTRVVDALGRDDADICFSGIFTGSNATLRARLLDELRAQGLPLPLTWDAFFYTVVVSQFQADYTTSSWIPYTITCTVLRDEASALIETAVSLGASLLSDLAMASTQASGAGVDLSSVQSLLSDPSATTRDTAAYGTALSGIAGAQSQLSGAIGAAQSELPMTELSSSGSASDGIAALNSGVVASQQLSQLVVGQAYLGRAAINLANAST